MRVLEVRRVKMSLRETAYSEAAGAVDEVAIGTRGVDGHPVPGQRALDHRPADQAVRVQEAGEQALPARLSPERAAAVRRTPRQAGADLVRRHITGPQRLGAILLAACCLAGATWYVPRIVAADARTFTGTVSSDGITDLNFASPGLVGRILVRPGADVKAGQVLATETSPAATAAITADQAAIAADKAKLAGLRAVSAPGLSIVAAQAQLAKDQAQLAADEAKLMETQVVAPARGEVVAVNGQPGEAVTSAGVRSYSAPSPSSGQPPAFSLLPEGPAPTMKSSSSASAQPLISLRTSADWQVKMLLPESSIAAIRPGLGVTVSVPAAGLSAIRGYIQELLPTPVSTSAGVAYQAVVHVLGQQRAVPLSGMTANVQLGS
jgi:multidrug efflux pump subunit AcrA (membrane-fusion protein)